MSRLFQIHEDDLAKLESLLPEIADALYTPALSNRLRMKIRAIKEIVSNVRWNYGPPSDVEVIPAGPDEPE